MLEIGGGEARVSLVFAVGVLDFLLRSTEGGDMMGSLSYMFGSADGDTRDEFEEVLCRFGRPGPRLADI